MATPEQVTEQNPPSTRPPLMFTATDLQLANEAWGCNCGPASLAAVWKLSLSHVRKFLGDFEKRGYMNAMDMQAALARLRLRIKEELADGGTEQDLWPSHGLALIQFSGPWITSPNASTKWALTQTHWIATKWDENTGERWIFDVNAMSWQKMLDWQNGIFRLLLSSNKDRDGAWWLRHSWEIRKDPGNWSRKRL